MRPSSSDHLDRGQAVAVADLEVVGVVGRRDLQAAGAEGGVHIGVPDDGDFLFHQGQNDGVGGEVGIPVVLRVNGHGGVPQHGFGPGGGHGDAALAVRERIENIIKVAVEFFVFHLQVRQGRMAPDAPVDDVIPLVDQALIVEIHEDLSNRPGQALVHGEPLAVPVAGGPQPLELVDDGAAVFFSPFPDGFDELLPSQLVPVLPFACQVFFHHVLGGDARMVGPRHPEHIVAPGPPVPAEHILEHVVECMTHVEDARDVGRRDDDGVGFAGPVGVRGEGLVGLPFLGPAGFHVRGFVPLGQVGFCH